MQSRLKRRPVRLPEFVVVGKVVAAHGIRGEVRVVPVETTVDRLLELDAVFCRRDDRSKPAERRRRYVVEGSRLHRSAVLFKLRGVDDRDVAEGLRGCWLEIPGDELKPLPAGRYYVFELVGCRVDTVDGRSLGEVAEVLDTGANDVYVVRGADGRETLIPAIKPVIQQVDVEAGRIVIDPLPGLIDDDGDGGP